jgi:Tfp pilus assembly protein PilX
MATRYRRQRGTALLLSIVVSIIVTALVVAMAWVAGEQTQRTGNLSKLDQAFFAAEAGAHRVMWYCKNDQMSSITSPLTGSINGYNYSVSWSTVSGKVIAVTSVATTGNVSYTLSETITPPTLIPPVLATTKDFDNKNITINGNVMVGGDYSNGGSGSLAGDLVHYGNASNTGNVSGDITHESGSFTPLDMAIVRSTLVAAAGQTFNGKQTDKTFNFSALPGTNKVIYVNGDVVDPTFVGTGTLYVKGKVSVGGFGTSSNPVHIVADEKITTYNNVTMYGSIYTADDWDRGKFDLTGMLYVAGKIEKSNSGQSSLTQTTTPWWDPRLPGNTQGTAAKTVITKFSGPGI